MRPAQLIIPCYNEEKRLDPAKVEAIVADPNVGVVLVNDGSRDRTLEILKSLERKDVITVLDLPRNVGKGEAVRAGLLHGISLGASRVGYADADFSTAPPELLRLLARLDEGRYSAVMGLRLARLGAAIERKRARHYLGRVFATCAAITLDLMVYDTQCGAKWFLVTDSLKHSVGEKFHTRWVFDVEIIGRLLGRFGQRGPTTQLDGFIEEPLRAWEDVGGSKLSVMAMGKAFWDLFRLLVEAHTRR